MDFMLLLYHFPFTEYLHLILKTIQCMQTPNGQTHHRGDWGIEVANVWPVELSVLCTLLRLLQVKHLRFNGLKIKFDNYHRMVKKVFSLRFGFKLKRWYWPCKMHYNVCCWEVYHLQSRSSYVLKREGWEDPKRPANSENKINNSLFLVNRPACIDK